MLSALYFPFSLIGLSEIKFRDNQDPLTNIQIAGYEFASKPSLSNAGGVAFYIKKNLNFKIKNEISVIVSDFESLWIEIESVGQPNLICGMVYRHPNGNLDHFMEYLDHTVDLDHTVENLFIDGGFQH
jgi:exonuclease III